MSRPILRNSAPHRAFRGFTLIETALATIIIGVGVVSLMQLLAAGTLSNAAGTELTTAVNLANNIHEIMTGLTLKESPTQAVWNTKEANVGAYNDVIDFDGSVFSPPIDVTRQPIATYGTWTQKVKVSTVAPDNLSSIRPNDITQPNAQVRVDILHNNKLVYTTTWIVSTQNGP